MLLKEVKMYFIKKVLIKPSLSIYEGVYQMKKEGRLRTETHCYLRVKH